MKKTFVMLPLVLALTACGSLKYGVELESKSPFTSSPKTGDEVKYPSWYTEKYKDGALYAVASEYSKDMQFAVDKATLSAKRNLASNFSSHVNAMMKDYATEVGDDSSVMREIDRTTKLIVNKVNLVGIQKTNFKIEHEKEGYRAWIQLRYSVDDTNKLLMAEIKRNRQLETKLSASKSFRELEKETNPERVEVTRVEPQPRIDSADVRIDERPVQ
jgi:hypothetical protein